MSFKSKFLRWLINYNYCGYLIAAILFGSPVYAQQIGNTKTYLSKPLQNISRPAAFNIHGQVVANGSNWYDKVQVWNTNNTITELPRLPGTQNYLGWGYGINDSGHVVGYNQASNWRVPFIWTPTNGITDLTAWLGDDVPFGINNLGQILGNGAGGPFIWDSIKGLQRLPFSYGVCGINDSGIIVGSSFDGGSANAFVWSASQGIQWLFPKTGPGGFARGINNDGKVVGGTDTGAFIWSQADGMKDLNTLVDLPLDEKLMDTVGINNRGEIMALGKISGYLLTPKLNTNALASVGITSQPQSVNLDPGTTTTFSIVATNAIFFQWTKDGNPLPGATNSTLTLANARPAMIGDYTSVVSNAAGSVTSSVASLSIKGVDSGIWKGLVAYYPFNGNANDESGNGRQGTLNGATVAFDRFGKSEALNFNGISQFASLPIASNLNNVPQVTISLWINDASAQQTGAILGNWSESTGGIYINDFEGSNIAVALLPNGQINTVAKTLVGTWKLVTVVFNGVENVNSKRLIMYLDGVPIDIILKYNIPINLPSGASSVLIGARQIGSAAGDYFSGQIDDVRIYNRALSDTEVKALYDYESRPPVQSEIPEGMTLIPAGPFQMGDARVVGPVHTVLVSAFAMDKWEVSIELWDSVRGWGNLHGYDLAAGGSFGAKHPVHSVSWWDVLKWNNARSEKEGKVPAYYVDAAMIQVYRSEDKVPAGVKWDAGYRLPTEAEWEKAARGGVAGKLYPWGTDEISAALANYDVSNKSETMPVGSYGANGYGLYDMPGNVWEWCWDWNGYYAQTAQTDPRGPSSGSYRVIRGGSWRYNAVPCQVADRNWDNPNHRNNDYGFRSVLPSFQPVIVLVPVSLTQQPQSVVGVEGDTVQLSVTATGSPTLTYQWFKDGNAVPAGTNAALTLANVRPAMIGDYTAVVSNSAGSVTSSVASLSIKGVDSGIWKGLVAYYPFNGNANDESGNRNNGSSVSTQLTQDRFGNSANALGFNGAGSFVVVPHSKSIAIQSDVTISVWKKGRTPTSYYENYITKRDGQGNWNYSLGGSFTYGPGGCPGEKDKYVTGRRNSGQMELKFTDATVSESIGIWVNLVISIRDKRATFSINGIPTGTSCFGSDFTLPSVDVGAPLTIGSFEGDWYNGALDDVRIYNRALSDTEVKSLYDSERFPDTVISAQPASLIVPLGGAAQLSVTATNPIPTVQFAYQWFKDGAKLMGATNSTLNLGQLRLAQIGNYTVTVDDGISKLTSTEANVSLQGVDSAIWKGLIASYTFEGNFNDSSGFGDSLVPYGVVNIVEQGRRPETKAARVSGSDGFLVGPERAWFSGAEPRTISVWLKPESTSTNVSTIVTLGGIEDCSQRFSLQVPSAQNGIRFDGGDCSNGVRSKTFVGSSVSGKWTQAVITYDGTSVRCYVNGLASGTAYAVALNTDPIAPLVIGNTVGTDGEGFSGWIDDVRLYNRSLSATEVRSLFNYESSGVTPSLPQITRQPAAVSGYEGETLKLSVEASGYQLGYQWQKGGQNLSADLRLQGVSASELQIKGAKIEDIGDYRVLVTNVYGWVASATVKVAVVPPVRSLVAGLASEVQEGQRMSFPLSMVSTGDVGGLTFKLNYNSAFLTDPKVEWSALVGQSVNTVNTTVAGEVSGSFSLAGIALPSGIVGLGTVHFRARSVPMMTNAVLSPVIVSVGNPSGGSLTSGNGAIAGEGRIRPRRIKGDNNANQRVDIGDATVISRLLVALEEVRVWDVPLNDLNNTGDLDNGDVIKSLRTVVGLDPQPGPMGDAKRLSVALALEPTPKSTHYSAELALLDGPTIQMGRPYRVAVKLKAGQGDLTGLSFSLKYPASLELKEKAISAGVPTDALPAWNVSGNRAKLAVIRPKAWAAHSGTVAVFTFVAKPEAAKQVTLPIRLEDMEVADVAEGLSAIPSVWLEIGGGLTAAPELRVRRAEGAALSLEVVGGEGLPMVLEGSVDMTAWTETQRLTGQGTGTPVKVTLQPDPNVQTKFWRVRVR